MVSVLKKGAIADGKTDNTSVFQSVLDEMKETGGMLCVPAGKYVIGSIQLYSNTTLYLEAGAVLCASDNKELFPVIEEKELSGFVRGTRRGILFSLNAENVTIKGEGTIDGRGYNWWESGEDDEKRPRTIQFINVDNMTVEGITIKNSPCWTVHPIHCNNVTIHNISILNPYDSPNTDGINPESCCNVRISDCYVDVGDDCVTIKSGLERDLFQKQFPCENITVTNCTFVHGHGGIVIGSEMSGGVRNITVSNCIFRDTDRGIRVKTRRQRGGYVEDVLINNIIIDNAIGGITMNMYYTCGASPDREDLFTYEPLPVEESTPSIRNIILSNVLMKNIKAAGVYFVGLPEQPIKDIKIMNAEIKVTGNSDGIECIMMPNAQKVYGDGICLKNVENVKISGCEIVAKDKEYEFTDAENTFVNGKKV